MPPTVEVADADRVGVMDCDIVGLLEEVDEGTGELEEVAEGAGVLEAVAEDVDVVDEVGELDDVADTAGVLEAVLEIAGVFELVTEIEGVLDGDTDAEGVLDTEFDAEGVGDGVTVGPSNPHRKSSLRHPPLTHVPGQTTSNTVVVHAPPEIGVWTVPMPVKQTSVVHGFPSSIPGAGTPMAGHPVTGSHSYTSHGTFGPLHSLEQEPSHVSSSAQNAITAPSGVSVCDPGGVPLSNVGSLI